MSINTQIPNHGDFRIALICALSKEASCLLPLLDQTFETPTEKLKLPPGDHNHYTIGVIGRHNVVVAHMPGMGTDAAASVATNLKRSFQNIRLAIVVGVCGGMPYTPNKEEIILGDVIISKALIKYDFGRKYPHGFERKTNPEDVLGRQSPDLRAFLAKLEAKQAQFSDRTYHYFQGLQGVLPAAKIPGRDTDNLYPSQQVHQHRDKESCKECTQENDKACSVAIKSSCKILECDTAKLVHRSRLSELMQNNTKDKPMIYYGRVGSGNTVLKSGLDRDQMAAIDDIIALEMEGAGVWEHLPTIVVKGVCDYADSHKSKGWQLYAAASAAACTKAMLEEWPEELCNSREPVFLGRSHLPYDVCVNHISRTLYMSRLEEFFKSWQSGPKRFILWGLGGIGKTQIALKYAMAQSLTLSVFWIRADKKENFLIDYQKILEVLDEGLFSSVSSKGSEAVLKATLRTLEQEPSRWLLVFDNADKIEDFRKQTSDSFCLGDYIPCSGRVIITTRTSKFVGEFARPDDGLEVRPMSQQESTKLFQESIPTKLRKGDYEMIKNTIAKLLDELGGLPLAIAQAAANIRHLQLSVPEYVDLYREKKSRTELLSEAVHDPRRPPQSVLLTWQISFDHVLEAYPLAGDLVGYLACLHWQNVPEVLLRLSPNFQNCSRITFAYMVAELVHLSLLQRVEEGLYQLHPMVHLWLIARLSRDDREKYLRSTLKLLATEFSTHIHHETTSIMLLLPHALEVIDQTSVFPINDVAFVAFALVMAPHLVFLHMMDSACHLMNRALVIGSKVIKPQAIELVQLRKSQAPMFNMLGKFEAAVEILSLCLQDLKTVNASEEDITRERKSILSAFVEASEKAGRPDLTATARKDLEAIQRVNQSSTDDVDGKSKLESLQDQYLYALRLKKIGYLDEAELLIDEILNIAESDPKTLVPEETYFRSLRDKGNIFCQKGKFSEALVIQRKLYQHYSRIGESWSVGFWIATNSLSLTLLALDRWDEIETLCHEVFKQNAIPLLQGLLLDTVLSFITMVTHAKWVLGKYADAERLALQALEMESQPEMTDGWHSHNVYRQFKSFYVYALCYSVAKQGRMDDLGELKHQFRDELTKAEAVHGTIEEALARDAGSDHIYKEACNRLMAVGKKVIITTWWLANKKIIEMVDWRSGRVIHKQLHEVDTMELVQPQIDYRSSGLVRKSASLPTFPLDKLWKRIRTKSHPQWNWLSTNPEETLDDNSNTDPMCNISSKRQSNTIVEESCTSKPEIRQKKQRFRPVFRF